MTYEKFTVEVERLLNGTAAGKGYNGSGPDGDNELYQFVQTMTGGHHHACGEIIYKVRRFEAKGNLEDILKAAAWCFLIYKHEIDLRRSASGGSPDALPAVRA